MDILSSSPTSCAQSQHNIRKSASFGCGESDTAAFDAAAIAKRKLKQRRKRKQVKRACSNCRKAHSGKI